jgi:predicted TIM-barrel fold metal-dependent hydrolase
MIIDSDTHFWPPDAFDYVDESLADRRPVLKFNAEGRLVAVDFPGEPAQVPGTSPLPGGGAGSGAQHAGNYDIEARLRVYQGMGIDRQLILPQPSALWSYLVEPDLATAMARSWNRSVARLQQDYPGQVDGVATVALQDVEGAIEDVIWAKQHGLKAVTIDKVFPVQEHPFGTPLGAHRELWPFFQQVEAVGLPVILHAYQHGHRPTNFLIYQMDGLNVFAPSESQLTMASLITSGLLDEFPGLQFVMAEQGTAFIRPLAERLDAAFHRAAQHRDDDSPRTRTGILGLLVDPEVALPKNKYPPTEYLRRNFYWTIETEEPELADAVQFIGPERFLFATDYPHDDTGGRMKFEDVRLLRANDRIAESDKALIWSENAARLFRL